ncbi:hypothetical protein LTR02_016812 [Friedmanniomyces endolithicus]|nr:hypothetical protein LTR94_021679 [Friedmanniomyces endolithicus]KAK0769287.1 hypothetical protein LTR59_017117 [Friedmanniomyces endolithicus]KAK0771807.1 hypothetical protein LTR38_017095 [Friedmanniomyces endolithicus]KAK0807009.1 hypothetical protein LTR75_006818 [Friedmanniomyces endolithicus]KAK0858710.1 hypothetical protein LTR03_000135 [Friedmanniomyces endolithicus]
MDDHTKAVARISAQIFSFYQDKIPFRLYHGSTNSTKSRKVDPSRMVDTSTLNHVLNVNPESKTCLVEPNVSMDQLVDATLPYGLVSPVVMEFPGITVGGGFAGTAGESSGFRYGFFGESVNWIEIVLANGETVTASPREREDLFRGASGSFGTLGVTTLLELRLIDAKRYVELTYHSVTSTEDALATMKVACQVDAGNDYVDGILFAPDRGVIITGRLTDDLAADTKIQRFSRAQDPWFYLHAESGTRSSSDGESVKEATELRDYLFRYDRGAFWTGKYAFDYFLVPFNSVTKYLLDYFMHTRVMYHALHASGHAKKYLIQDLLLPEHNAEAFVEFVGKDLGTWPIWLCPFVVKGELALHPMLESEKAGDDKGKKGEGDEEGEIDGEKRTFINVGVWGPGSSNYDRFVDQNRRLERKVRELGGIKWLYAQAYYTEDEFREIYDQKWYEVLREKYHATHLPSVFEKVKVDLSQTSQVDTRSWSGWMRSAAWNMWPVSGLYGVYKTLSGRDYLLAK